MRRRYYVEFQGPKVTDQIAILVEASGREEAIKLGRERVIADAANPDNYAAALIAQDFNAEQFRTWKVRAKLGP